MIKKAFFEAAFVVLGVVLALGANQWREARAEGADARAALHAIHEEISRNRSMVMDAIEAHDARLQAIGNPTSSEPLKMSAFQDGFIKPASALSDAAWNSASETGATAHMDFETVRELATLYAHQDRYGMQVTSYAALIYESLFKEGYGALFGNKPGLMTMIRTLKYQEESLLASYDAYLLPISGDD